MIAPLGMADSPTPQKSAAAPIPSRRLLVIFNPAAGRKPKRRLAAIVGQLRALGCAVTLRRTTAPGEAARIAAASAAEFDLVVAAGGDGTVNEVANGLRHRDCPLGVLPLGTGNVLASEIGLPRRDISLARLLASAAPQPIWPGDIAGRQFLMMAGVGFDAAVLQSLDPRWKRRVGKLAVVAAIVTALCRHRPARYRILCDGTPYEAASAVIAKGHFYAGRFVLAPAATLDEPVLHAVLFLRGRRLDALRYLIAMALGLVPRLRDVRIVAARRIELLEPHGAPVEADGDIVAQLPATITLAPQPIRIVGGAATRSSGR